MAARLAIAAAVCVALNLALTMQNAWPSIWVRVGAGVSIELLALVAVFALWLERRPAIPKWLAWSATVFLFFLIVGRYAAVTANALFGRSINVYFDIPQLPAVISMNAASRSPVELLLLTVLAIGVPLLLLVGIRLAVGTIGTALSAPAVRRPVLALALLGVGLYAFSGYGQWRWADTAFAKPVTPVYGEQIRFVADALTGPEEQAARAPLPKLRPAGLNGADVFVFFLESYGEVAYGVPEIADGVRPRIAAAEAALRDAGWHMASAYFTSPTFGGASWLAHSSFLTGRPVSGNRDYQLLLSGQDPSLVGAFRQGGYRTIGLMPGLKLAWPEGTFYGYDKVYDAAEIGYDGWPFGWWATPDQFSLAHMFDLEAAPSARQPLFVVFPTIMSHMPFSPVPKYQSDWSRAADAKSYEAIPILEENQVGRWERARAAYRSAMLYNIDMVEGFLMQRAPDDALVLVLGDHQPPGVVSGPGASWQVPVHIFSRDPVRIEKFIAAGFSTGFAPKPGTRGDFEALHRAFVASVE